MTTVFGKIIKGELSAEKIFENERIIVIKDLYPVAPVHLLIIPKKEIPNLQSIQQEDLELVSEIVVIAQQLAKQFNIEEGYRLITNNGTMAGQVIFHLHFHLIGGRQLGSLG
ncbi:HIT-like protein [Candidatus Protochlamydia amoebophila]|uniref:HIT domain-containing protein n=1 Tax=Candidatus Protochlamydia TaxID=282132 RepID=UPI0005AB2BDB|nr:MULTISPECIES: HIT domain-containing protein [Protochlamydia]MBS4163863.1 HIT-like protein [Candidatus Protochlamydia amoebophila]